jgi:hypothetical protein
MEMEKAITYLRIGPIGGLVWLVSAFTPLEANRYKITRREKDGVFLQQVDGFGQVDFRIRKSELLTGGHSIFTSFKEAEAHLRETMKNTESTLAQAKERLEAQCRECREE